MFVGGDLGFSSLVLVVCVVFPVIGLIIRRKWRIAVARKEEIQRLLILASEEASRAELEATLSYGAVSVPRNIYQCAVCYSPTTTRCAQCKAVRYCSGKCQIIHWRQGHKEECHPPSTTYCSNDYESKSEKKVAKQEQNDNYGGRYKNANIKTSFVEPGLSNSSCSSEVPCVKDNVEADISESSSTSFSGFSTSATGESSDDASFSGNISSNEPEGSDGQMPAGIVSDMLESSLDNVDRTKPLSPKFASLVDSVDSSNKFSELNESKLSSNNGDSRQRYASSSGQNTSAMLDDFITKTVKVAPCFSERTFDFVESSSDARDDSIPSHSSGAANSRLSDSESSAHVKFNLLQRNVPSLHAQNSEVKGTMSNDALPTTLENSSPVDKTSASLSKTSNVDAPNNSRSPSESHEGSTYTVNNFGGDSNLLKSSDLKTVSPSSSHTCQSSSNGGNLIHSNASKVCRSPSSSSNGSNLVVNDPAIHLSRSRLLSSSSQRHLVSNVNGNSVSSVKFGNTDNAEAGAVNSTQMPSVPLSSISELKSSMWKVVDQFRGPKIGRYSDKGLFAYDLFVKLYTSNKVDLGPCGLINCNNSCYANAVLQCLAFTPPLTAYFVQGLHSKTCVNKVQCFTCELENLVLKAKDGKSPLSPIGILSQLQKIGSQLGNGREEDAHEFLRYAIDTMQSICLKEAGVNALGSLEEETTLIGLTFGGYLRSKIKCMKCQYKSERQERIMDLTVEIEGDIGKLEDALKRFTGTEILDGDNKYQCSRCKSFEKAKKKLTILDAPNVLTIALKRFQSGKFGKLNKSIRFPEILDLAPYMSGTSDKSPIYRLYGVVVHLDVMNASFSGHYVCYVKSPQNKWFKIDDSTVTAVELDRVLTKGAYMLLYARCSPRAPRLMRYKRPDPKAKVGPSLIDAKLSSRSTSTHSSANSIPPDSMASVESFYLKFHRLQRILGEDSSSDNYSFTSSNSDEGSCSTDSTRDSMSADDISDHIFGGWINPWRKTSDSDTSSSSSSPLYSIHSPFADTSQRASSSPSRTCHVDSDAYHWDRAPGGNGSLEDSEGRRGDPFLHTDSIKQGKKVGRSSNSSRETNSAKQGWVNSLSDVKSGASYSRSASERTY